MSLKKLCVTLASTRSDWSYSLIYKNDKYQRLLTSSGRHRNCKWSPKSMDTAMALNRKLQNQKKLFFSGFHLLNQLCYTHRHYFNSFGIFRVFSIQIYQLYAYHIFWARVAGI
jgi:hypothetical protein